MRGRFRFCSLSFYQALEDEEGVRQDPNEGRSFFRPDEGLKVTLVNRPGSFTIPGGAHRSLARVNEIFVFCLSMSESDELRTRFRSTCCVEILSIPTFCDRVAGALATYKAKFPRLPGRSARFRVGHRVIYYSPSQGGDTRHMLPDRIAFSKFDSFAWQDEFRLIFSLTDALEYGNTQHHIIIGKEQEEAAPQTEPIHIDIGDLSDICKLMVF